MEFHFTLYHRVEMPSLLWMIENFWRKPDPTLHTSCTIMWLREPEPPLQGPHIHSTIIQALRTGDAGLVKERLERDLLDKGQGIVSLLTHNGAEMTPELI